MRELVYAMGVSLDGFIADGDGRIDWSAPDEELHRWHNEQARSTALELYGRRLYETMRPWQTADADPEAPAAMKEFAEIWRATPKLVFSRTLTAVEGNATLATGDAVETVRQLKEQPGGGLSVGGAGLASALVEAGLVDEYRLVVNPVVLGGGTPFFPQLGRRIPLELVETRTFGSQVVLLRYRAA